MCTAAGLEGKLSSYREPPTLRSPESGPSSSPRLHSLGHAAGAKPANFSYTLLSHTQAVGDVAPRCLGRPHNAHHLAALHAVVPRHRVRKLYARQLRVFDLVSAGCSPLCELRDISHSSMYTSAAAGSTQGCVHCICAIELTALQCSAVPAHITLACQYSRPSCLTPWRSLRPA